MHFRINLRSSAACSAQKQLLLLLQPRNVSFVVVAVGQLPRIKRCKVRVGIFGSGFGPLSRVVFWGVRGCKVMRYTVAGSDLHTSFFTSAALKGTLKQAFTYPAAASGPWALKRLRLVLAHGCQHAGHLQLRILQLKAHDPFAANPNDLSHKRLV